MKQTNKQTNKGERTLLKDSNRYEFERVYRLALSLNKDTEKKVALDYGCGNGYGTAFLASGFGKVTGIDVSEEAIKVSRTSFISENLSFEQFDPQYQPFADASFDFIGSFQVFEHIQVDKTNDFIRYVWAMLRPGGIALVTTPNALNYYGGHSGNPFHVKEYTFNELDSSFAAVIDRCHYNIVAVSDVPSTTFGNYLRRLFRGSRVGALLGKLLELSLKPFERHGIINTDYKKMLRGKRDDIIGSLLVEVRKPGC